MKFALSILILLFSSKAQNSTLNAFACDTIPELNKQIVAFVKGSLNKKVGRGECWDLAAQALNKVGANWDKNYVFGKEVAYKTECVYPGDIIQFEGVEIEYKRKDILYHEQLEHHTAVVYLVKDKGKFVVAEQNTNTHGKKVGLSDLELNTILKGDFKIFRPNK